MDTQPVTNTADVETLLRELLTDQSSDFLDSLREWDTYEDAGILTRDKGLVLRFANGAEFQLTIVQSRWGQDTGDEDAGETETFDGDEADAALWDTDLYSR